MTLAEKLQAAETGSYPPVVLEDAAKATIKAAVLREVAKLAYDARDASLFAQLRKRVHETVDHFQSHLPSGAQRVDGNSIAPILQDSVAEIQDEWAAMKAVDPLGCPTKTAYKSALGKVKKHLDPQKFADGLMAQLGCNTWAQVKQKMAPMETL